MKLVIFLILGQYVHFPSLVQGGTSLLLLLAVSSGGYLMTENVNISLRMGSFLKPTNGGSVFFTIGDYVPIGSD